MAELTRRELIEGAAMLPVASSLVAQSGTRGRLKQSVCRWCYRDIPLRDLCKGVADMGLTAMDLLTPEEWPVAKEFGLTCSMGSGLGGPIEHGLNDPANHEKIVSGLTAGIPLAAKAGVPNVITFFGNRRGRSDEEAIANSVAALNKVKRVAEDHGVTVCIELLNSKVNHKDYMCDRTPWGVALVKKVGSPRFKLLYDIYHMQIMEGDLARTVERLLGRIGHIQLADVPDRHEPGTGEINYAFLLEHLDRVGYSGWVGCEYNPRGDTLEGLKWARPYLS